MRSDRGQSGAERELAGDRARLGDAVETLEQGWASRRSFLRGAALAAGTSTVVLAGGSTALAAGGGTTSTQQTLPYQNDPNWVKNHFQNIINNETNHLDSLVNELGVFARPKPTFTGLTVTSLQQYVAMGALFCSTGAGAYLGAAPYIMNTNLLGQAGSIGQVELAQSSYLYTLLDQPFLPGGSPYGVPLTLQQILDRAAPFVTSLNGGPSPVFSTTEMSLENDIAIFNVALLLEYLEYEFYTTNFPVIFPTSTTK